MDLGENGSSGKLHSFLVKTATVLHSFASFSREVTCSWPFGHHRKIGDALPACLNVVKLSPIRDGSNQLAKIRDILKLDSNEKWNNTKTVASTINKCGIFPPLSFSTLLMLF